MQSPEISEHVWRLHQESRWLFNRGVKLGFDNKSLTNFDAQKLLTTIRNGTEWCEGYALFQRASIINGLKSIRLAESNHKKFHLPKVESPYGYFRKKQNGRQPAICSYQSTLIKNGTFKFGEFRLILNTHIYDGLKPLSFQIIETTKKITGHTRPGDRTYRIHFQFEHVPNPNCNSKTIWIDLGARNMMGIADEDTHETRTVKMPNGLKRFKRDGIDRTRSALSKKKKGSRSYRHLREKMLRMHKKLKNRQADFVRQTIKSEFDGVKTAVIEKLDIHSMTYKKRQEARGMKRTKGMNRVIRNSAIGEKRDYIRRYCEMNGIDLHEVPAAYTSQACHACGFTDKRSRNGDSFDCISCGRVYTADENAPIIVLGRHHRMSGTLAVGNIVMKQKDGTSLWKRSVWKEKTNPIRFGNDRESSDPKDFRNAGTNQRSLEVPLLLEKGVGKVVY